MMGPQIKLKLGDNPLPIHDAVARVEMGPSRPHNPFGSTYVMVIIGVRDAGSWAGTHEECEVWLEGFLIGRLGTVGR